MIINIVLTLKKMSKSSDGKRVISRKKPKSVGDIILIYNSVEPNTNTMKKDLNLPAIIKQHCGIYSGESGTEGIRMDIYKWCGTDRVSIQWLEAVGKKHKVIGKMEMHYLEHYENLKDLLEDREHLTKVMEKQNWGVLDIRDLQNNREF